MERIELLKRTTWVLILGSMLVTASYFFIDRAVAIEVAHLHLRSYKALHDLSKIPELFTPLAVIIYMSVLVRFCLGRSTSLDTKLLLFANGIAITYFLKDCFKLIFGRTWPETWIHHHPAFLQNEVYGFNYFHGTHLGAFPSGHAAILLAGTILLWHLYPRFKALYAVLIFAGVIGILGMNYHFVGDVIGGSMLGYLVALFTFYVGSAKS